MTDLPKPSKGGLHYRLTSSEWEKVWQELKPTEVRILYHLRLLDPFGDRSLDIGVRELARTLNIDHSTVSRALKTLDAKGYIDLELLQVKVRIHSKVEAVVSESTTSVSTHHLRLRHWSLKPLQNQRLSQFPQSLILYQNRLL